MPHKRETVIKVRVKLCDDCDNLVNQREKFSANLTELKRQPPNNISHLLPWYKTT